MAETARIDISIEARCAALNDATVEHGCSRLAELIVPYLAAGEDKELATTVGTNALFDISHTVLALTKYAKACTNCTDTCGLQDYSAAQLLHEGVPTF